jgi:hypothetical protein
MARLAVHGEGSDDDLSPDTLELSEKQKWVHIVEDHVLRAV